ncbi:hypothetical protein J6590_084254 [Homalodisca vitripennis]|nr:hypothetical protein J6590_084254 [Homalodisca vitripennis]
MVQDSPDSNALIKYFRTVKEASEQPREEIIRASQDSLSSDSYHNYEEMSEQEVYSFEFKRLKTAPDNLFTTSSNRSRGTTSVDEKRKKKWRPPRTFLPAKNTMKLISGIIKYAYGTTNQDPSSILYQLSGSGTNINFTQPGHFFYQYYKKQYNNIFKNTTSSR